MRRRTRYEEDADADSSLAASAAIAVSPKLTSRAEEKTYVKGKML